MRNGLRVLMLVAVASLCPFPAAAGLVATHLTSDAEMLALLSDTLFIGEGRIGDRSGAATFEIDLGEDTGAPDVTSQYNWQSGIPVSFELTYDHLTNEVVFTVDSVTLQAVSPAGQYSDIFVRTRAVNSGSSIKVWDLVLDGVPVNDISHALGSDGLDILRIQGGTLSNGFTLSGTVMMQWSGTPPTQSRLAFQIKVGNTTTVPVDLQSWGVIKSLYR